MSFSINNEIYFSFPSINFINSNTDLRKNSGDLFLKNLKTDGDLILTLPNNSNFIGISLMIKNPNLTFNILSSISNIKQMDGSISNIICSSDNFSNIIFDGNYWLVTMNK